MCYFSCGRSGFLDVTVAVTLVPAPTVAFIPDLALTLSLTLSLTLDLVLTVSLTLSLSLTLDLVVTLSLTLLLLLLLLTQSALPHMYSPRLDACYSSLSLLAYPHPHVNPLTQPACCSDCQCRLFAIILLRSNTA